jgi:methyl-accepting chemotaxis protein
MSLAARMTSYLLVVCLAGGSGVGLALWKIQQLRVDARVVNHAGIVRGTTQRLVKLELAGQPTDALIAKLDGVVAGLRAGSAELSLPAATGPDFVEKMNSVAESWANLKQALQAARRDQTRHDDLLSLSEDYFEKTDAAVLAAEEASKKKVRGFALTLGVVGLVVGAVLFLVWRMMLVRVARPICQLAGRLSKVATGDLTVQFPASGEDEIGVLTRAAGDMVDATRSLILQASNASLELASMAEQLSASTSSIAQSNGEVSSQSQSVATAAEQMTATVEEAARNTTQVNDAAEQARTVASEGAGVISKTVVAVREIATVVEEAAATVRALGEESEKIGVVIQVIEDIADQTNLLALNAAIEAARAGEHGRGFAVVADEVRKLAEKTVRATQEIAKTISAIQTESQRVVGAIDGGMQQVTEGRELGEQAGQAIRDIEQHVAGATEQIRQIATATEELAATARDMAQNLDQISRGIQQNSQAATEISRTSANLAEKAEELRELTGRFTAG